MNKPCARITLDLQQASTPTFVAVKKSDIGREIRITLSDGGFPYEISADCYAVLTGTKPDGNILYNHCDIEGNTIVYEITEQTTAAAGRMKAEVKLYGADDILVTSATFRIIIDGTVYTDDKVESSSEFSALTQLISQVVEIIQKYSDVTIATKTSELINDSGFITNAVTDLVNYYTKTDIGNLLSNIPKFRISVVSSLPTEDISETTIYLLSGGDGSDLYTEYLRVDGKWEILGSQRVDLTGYATEEWVEQKLEEHSVDLSDYVQTVNGTSPDESGNVKVDVKETLVVTLMSDPQIATKGGTMIANAVANKQSVILKASNGNIYHLDKVSGGEATNYAYTAVFSRTYISDGDVIREVYTVSPNGSYAFSQEIVESSGGYNEFDPTVYGLPILHLTGDTTGMSKDNAVTLDYVYGELSGTATVKWQGASSLAYPKKNYTIQFDKAFEAVEGWGVQDKYCLKANFIDHSHARNVVSAKLWGEIVKSRENMNANLSALPNGGAVDGFPCIVMLNSNFHGLYTFNIPKAGWLYGMGNGEMNVERLSFKEYMNGEPDKTTGEYVATNSVTANFATNRNVSTTGGRTYVNWDVTQMSQIGAVAYLFDMDGNLVKAFAGHNGVKLSPYYGKFEGDLGEDAWLDVSSDTTRLDTIWDAKPLSLPVPKNHYVMWVFKYGGVKLPETSNLTPTYSAEAEANNTWSYSWARTEIEFAYESVANEIIVCADATSEATRFKAEATFSGDFDVEYASETVSDEDILSSLNLLITACINSDGTDLDSNIAKYLDWDSAIDYYIYTCLIGGADMAAKNYLLTTYDGTKWFFGAYDMDSTFGLWWDGKQFLPDNHYPTVEWYANYHRAMWLIWNYKRDAFKARYAQLRAGALSENNVALAFSNFINKIPSTVYMEDAKKWPGIPSTAANNLAQILNWYRMRVAVLDKEVESIT